MLEHGIPPDELTILEIEDTIKFNLGIFRLVGTDGIATYNNGEITFETDADFSGTMQFNEDTISIVVQKSNFDYIKSGLHGTLQLKTNNLLR